MSSRINTARQTANHSQPRVSKLIGELLGRFRAVMRGASRTDNADGVMIATQASPGQGTLQISPERAAPGSMAVVVIRNRKTGEGLKYTISDEWLPKILSWNQSEPPTRFDAAMAAEGLLTSEPAPIALTRRGS